MEHVDTYEKPEVLAQNEEHGSYAAGCPENTAERCWSNCEVRT